MKSFILGAVCASIALSVASAAAPPLPSPDNVLEWTPAQQAIGYRSMEKISPVRVVPRGRMVSPLPHAKGAFDVSVSFGGKTLDTAGFMRATNASGLIVVQHGRVLIERYGLGRTAQDRWTSFSVAKSVTSTLVGAAIKDGYIKSLSSRVTDYLPELRHTAYEGVTVGDLITMRSGVAWNEDYSDPKADVARYVLETAHGKDGDPIVAYCRARIRRARPSTTTPARPNFSAFSSRAR